MFRLSYTAMTKKAAQLFPMVSERYYPSLRTENKGSLALFNIRQGRQNDYNFRSEITETGNLNRVSAISSTVYN